MAGSNIWVQQGTTGRWGWLPQQTNDQEVTDRTVIQGNLRLQAEGRSGYANRRVVSEVQIHQLWVHS